MSKSLRDIARCVPTRPPYLLSLPKAAAASTPVKHGQEDAMSERISTEIMTTQEDVRGTPPQPPLQLRVE